MAMKAVKVVPTKDMVLAKTDYQLLKDVISIADLAAPFGKEPEATISEGNMDKAVEVLARVREANRKLTALHAIAVKGLKDEIKLYDDEKKAIAKRLDAADESVANRIIEIYRTVDKEAFDRRMAGALGSTLTVVPNGFTIEVVNADEVPDDFILPPQSRASRVNTAAIAEVLKAGGVVNGVKATKKYYLTTRAADTIKRIDK